MGKRVIFLDIDGVIQPGTQKRFDYDLDKLRETLAIKYDDEAYLEMCKEDLGAIVYDWDKVAVRQLRKLCRKANAEIVISSDWRCYSPLWRLKAFFRLHKLDEYITGVTIESKDGNRAFEVAEYLKENPDIDKFVILDDRYKKQFEELFPEHFIDCYTGGLDQEVYLKALDILGVD